MEHQQVPQSVSHEHLFLINSEIESHGIPESIKGLDVRLDRDPASLLAVFLDEYGVWNIKFFKFGFLFLLVF
jgi:hypothetical protein